MDDLISVICTVKNAENTIDATIDSVLNQTYQNIEFIIIDDGSTDRTASIIKGYQENDTRINYFNFGSLGRGKALNKAIELTNGKYIANIDADDLFHPQKLKIQYIILKNYPEILLLHTDTTIIYDDQQVEWEKIDTNKINNIEITNDNNKLFMKNNISHITVIFNKDKLIKLGKYDEQRKNLLDYELWLRAFSNGYELSKVNLELGAKRIHSNQSFENKRRLNYTFSSMKLQIKYIKSNPRYLYYLPTVIIRFILAQLPFKVRNTINQYTGKYN